MSCVYINKKSIEWKNFVAKVGSVGKATALLVMNKGVYPKEIVEDKPESYRFKSLVTSKHQTLEFIQSKIQTLEFEKKDADVEKAIEIQREINIYKKQQDKVIEDIDFLSVNEAKNQSLMNISKYAEDDLKEIKDMLNAPTIDASKLAYIQHKIRVWQNAGNFSEDHPYMNAEELELADSDEQNVYTDMKNSFLLWKGIADSLEAKFTSKVRALLTEQIKGTLKYKGDIDFDTMPEINALFKNTIGIVEMNSSLVQSLHSWLARADWQTTKDASVLFKEIERLMGRITKRGKLKEFTELVKQKHKGRLTKDLVDWKSFVFKEKSSKIYKEYQANLKLADELGSGDKNRVRHDANEELYSSLREIESGINPNELFSKDEAVSSKYKSDLQALLGQHIANILIGQANDKMSLYEKERRIVKSSLNDELGDDLITISKELREWEILYSPYDVYSRRFTTDTRSIQSLKVSNKFIVSFPKKVNEVNGILTETGYYDSQYTKIAADSDYLAAYDFMLDTLTTLNSLAPHNKLDILSPHALPDIEKTVLEDIFDGNAGGCITSIFEKFQKSVRVESMATVLDDEKMMPDGSVKKELQMNFSGNNGKVISDFIKLKSIQHSQKFKKEPTESEIKEWTYEIRDTLAKEKSWDLERILKAYALSVLTYKNRARISGVMELTYGQIQKSVTLETNNAGVEFETKGGKKFISNSKKNSLDLVTNYMDFFYGYKTRKEEGVGGKVLTADEKVIDKEIDVAIDNNIKEYMAAEKLISDKLLVSTITQIEKDELVEELKAAKEKFDSVNEILHNRKEDLGGNFVISRLLDKVLMANQSLKQAYNLIAAANNAIIGVTTLYIEASDGRRFNSKQLNRSIAMSKNSIAHTGALRFLDNKNARKTRNIMIYYDVMKESKNEIYEFSNKTVKKTGVLAPYAATSVAEYFNQSNTVLPILMNTKVTLLDGTVTNVFDASDESGRLPEGAVISDEFGEFDEFVLKGVIDDAIRSIHGNYGDKLMVKDIVAGRALSQFRTWAFMGVYERFGQEKYNQLARLNKKGRYITYKDFYKDQGSLKATLTIGKQLLRKMASAPLVRNITGIEGTTFDDIEGISRTDAANMRKNMTELLIILTTIATGVLASMLLLGDDDDDETRWKRMMLMGLLNTMDRTSNDLLFYSSPDAFQDINKSIIPAFSVLIDVGRLSNHIVDLASGEDDDGKLLKYSAKMVRGASQVSKHYRYFTRDMNTY